MNETQNNTENPQDLLNSSLIFAKALGLILNENEGIVVDVTGNIILAEDVNKVIVFRHEGQIKIYKCDQDLTEGTAVNMGEPTDDSMEQTTEEPEA